MTTEEEVELEACGDEATPDKPDDGDEAAPDDPARGPDRRLVIVLALSFIAVAAIVVVAYLQHSDDGCGSWEAQLDELAAGLTRHRLAKGRARPAAVQRLEALTLPCEKVAVVRDECVVAYRALFVAEQEQLRAKLSLKALGQAVGELDDRLESVAKRRILDNQPVATIAADLELSETETERLLGEAMDKIGRPRLKRLHSDFERSVKRSEQHVSKAKQHNESCDTAFKLLLRQSQSQ